MLTEVYKKSLIPPCSHIKGVVHTKMNTFIFTNPHVIQNMHDVRSSLKHNEIYFLWKVRNFCPSIENPFQQNFHKEIVQVIYVQNALIKNLVETWSLHMMNRFNFDYFPLINIDQHAFIEHIKFGKQKVNRTWHMRTNEFCSCVGWHFILCMCVD